MIEYRQKSASKEDVYEHLYECKNYFHPPLDVTVNLTDYSKKIFDRSITFEAWDDNKLIGLLACYLNDPKNVHSFITSVSVLKSYAGKGIAKRLMGDCLRYAVSKSFQEISLEVSSLAQKAVHIYKKYGFREVRRQGETILMTMDLE